MMHKTRKDFKTNPEREEFRKNKKSLGGLDYFRNICVGSNRLVGFKFFLGYG
jgi:hypothetical protein